MKLLPVILAHAAALAASAQRADITNSMQTAGYVVTERGEHHRVWSRFTMFTNEIGAVSIQTNQVTELATGMHRRISNHWALSQPGISLTSTGIVAQGASHSVLFAT